MKLKLFSHSKINQLLSWIINEDDQQLWSGNTFQEGLNAEILLVHLQRKDLVSFEYSEDDILLSYGEIVLTKKCTGVLCRVIVKPERRRDGIGSNFILQIIDWAFKKKSLKKITLNTFGHNIPARKCYKTLGFKEISYKRNFRLVKNQWRDLVIMEKTTEP